MSVRQVLSPIVTRINETTIRVTANRSAPLTVRLGVQGPPGVSGAASSSFEYYQSSAATVWTIAHPLNKSPSVSIVDTTGREVEGEVKWPNHGTVIVTFSVALSGTAYLN